MRNRIEVARIARTGEIAPYGEKIELPTVDDQYRREFVELVMTAQSLEGTR